MPAFAAAATAIAALPCEAGRLIYDCFGLNDCMDHVVGRERRTAHNRNSSLFQLHRAGVELRSR